MPDPKDSPGRASVVALLALALAAGLGARYGLPPFWAKVLGVALWSTAVYLGLLLLRPGLDVGRALLLVLAISWAVELAQLTPGPAWLSSKHLLLRLAFGTTFSGWDLPTYAVGAGLGGLIHYGLILRR